VQEINSKGNYCKSFKEVGEELYDLLTNQKGVSKDRAMQLLYKGLRYLKHPKYGGKYIQVYRKIY
jgi:hypothetical protein